MQLMCISDQFSNEDVKRNYRNLACCPLCGVIGYPVMAYLIWPMFGGTAVATDKASFWSLLIFTTIMAIVCTVMSVGIVACMTIALRKLSHLHSRKAFVVSIINVLSELLTMSLFVTTFVLMGHDYREFIICGLFIVLGTLKTTCGVCSLGTFKRYMQLLNPKNVLNNSQSVQSATYMKATPPQQVPQKVEAEDTTSQKRQVEDTSANVQKKSEHALTKPTSSKQK